MPNPIDTDKMRSRLDSANIMRGDVLALCDEIDRLRGENQTPPRRQGKTVEVKIPVVVTPEGKWHGYDYLNLEPGCVRYWLTATLPVPAEVEVLARVEGDAPYGYCPTCGAAGVWRERRPNGDDKCSNGHSYPSKLAIAGQSGPETRYK